MQNRCLETDKSRKYLLGIYSNQGKEKIINLLNHSLKNLGVIHSKKYKRKMRQQALLADKKSGRHSIQHSTCRHIWDMARESRTNNANILFLIFNISETL